MPRHQQNTISNSQGNPEKTQTSGENKSFKKSKKKINEQLKGMNKTIQDPKVEKEALKKTKI